MDNIGKFVKSFVFVLLAFASCQREIVNKNEVDDEPDDTTTIVLKDTIEVLSQIVDVNGDTLDNNGVVREIRKKSGKLPSKNVIAPLSSKPGQAPALVEIKKKGTVLSDRLNITLLDDSVSIDSFSIEFSKKFDRKRVEVVGVNRTLLAIQLRVNADEREELKSAIKDSMKGWNIIVENDYIQKRNDYGATRESKGWHLDALSLKDAWKITKGNPNTIIAIVDDGIRGSHLMLRGKIVKPYNVFTQTNQVSAGDGHGTHVAAIAAGSEEFYDSEGASGIAPNCKIMPIQVFDNDITDVMAIISGVLDAIDHGARIINVSIGKNLKIFSILSISEQIELSKELFLDEEAMWKRVYNHAKKHNAILVFSAGNDNVVSALDPHNRSDYSITVAAVDANGKSTKFTNYGEGTDISAYGEAINSAGMFGNFVKMDGTSMSAPIVAGTIALMRGVRPNITASECLDILKKTGLETDKYTPVMVNPYRALKYLQTGKIVKLPTNQLPKNDKSRPLIKTTGINYGPGDYVDLDLPSGLKWAACNVGASKPWEYGNYYAWGETDDINTKTFNRHVHFNTYRSSGIIDENGNLTSKYDVSTQKWGDKWRIPTKEELDELLNNCNWTSIRLSGIEGYKVSSKKDTLKWIFLPGAGFRDYQSGKIIGDGYYGYGASGAYASSTVIKEVNGMCYYIHFNMHEKGRSHAHLKHGHSIRPVTK